MHLLCDLVRTEPMLASCIERLCNNCLTNFVEVRENGRELAETLRVVVVRHYTRMLRQAVEVAIMAGFVPFYVRRIEGIPLPFIPELGTFVWQTEVNDKASWKYTHHEPGILRYRVRMLLGTVKSEEIHVVNWHVPQQHRGLGVYSPLRTVVRMHELFSQATDIALQKELWNTHKHLVVSEKLDLKDPTPSGIQLLDDMRRYSLTGQHDMMRNALSHYYSRRDNKKLHSVVDANHQWVRSEFADHESSAQAIPHIMPPNSLTEELSVLQSSDILPQMREQYQNAVHVFFNGFTVPQSGAKYVGAAGSEQASRAQQVTVLAMSRFLEHVAEHMYATSFDVEARTVQCRLVPRSRFELAGADDVKNLLECGVLTEFDKKTIRKLYIGSDMDV